MLKDAGIRITIIEKDGSVGYDNQFDSMAMENHNTRPEVVAAWENGEGTDVRNSTTLDQSTYYYAIALADSRVLRVSQEADNVISFVFSALPSLILILCFIFRRVWQPVSQGTRRRSRTVRRRSRGLCRRGRRG